MSYKIYKKGLIWDGAPHEEKKLSAFEMKHLLKNNKALLIRNVYNFDGEDHTSFWYIIKDQFGDMEELSGNTRSKIRRSLKLLEIKQIDKQTLIEKGYEVHIKALENYKNSNSKSFTKDIFINNLEISDSRSEFWGCFDKQNNKLIAYACNIVYEDMCDYSTLKAIPEYLTGYYPFYGLIYTMNKYYLEELGLRYVSDGARSITEHSNIQPFLIEKFKFRRSYCNFAIEYDFRLKVLIFLLFPFRKFISNLKISALLRQEGISRSID